MTGPVTGLLVGLVVGPVVPEVEWLREQADRKHGQVDAGDRPHTVGLTAFAKRTAP